MRVETVGFRGVRFRWAVTLCLTVIYLLLSSGTAQAQLTEVKLTAADEANGNQFGAAVAVDGETVLVGAILGDGPVTNSGAVYVYTRSGGSWPLQQKVNASDAAGTELFGNSVAIDGDTMVIGAPEKPGIAPSIARKGAAYVFTRTGTTWTEVKKLEASDGGAVDLFGSSVAISGDTVVVGSARNNSLTGAAYVFTRDTGGTGNWGQQQKLTALVPVSSSRFGNHVDIDGDTALIGAFDETSPRKGAAYVFTRTGTTWSQ